jgi:integrase
MDKVKRAYLPKLNDCGGDLSKKWFIYFSYRHPASGKMVRFKEYSGFGKLSTKAERYSYSKILIDKLKRKLRKGWNPFMDENILYDASSKAVAVQSTHKSIDQHLQKILNTNVRSRNPHTVANYRCYIRNLLTYLKERNLSDCDINVITEAHAEDFLSWLTTEKHLSNKTRNEHLSLFKRLFQVMVRKEIIVKNAFEFCITLKHYRKPREYYRDQIRTVLLQEFEQDKLLLLFVELIYYTLRRPAELRKLRIRHINMEQAVFVFDEEIAKTDEQETVDIPVQLYRKLLEMDLHKYPEDFFLLTTQGRPGVKQIGKNFFYKKWIKIRDRFGLPSHYGLYQWKHTASVSLILSGVDLKTIQEHGGWSTLSMVENYAKSFSMKGSYILRERYPDIGSQTAIQQLPYSPK